MKSYSVLLLCLSCLCAGGCAGTRQRQIGALERENSQLNGLLWEMEFELESLQEENDRLKQSREGAEEDAEDSTPSRSTRAPKESDEPPPFDPGDFHPPVIEFPSEPTPGGSVPDSLLPGQTHSRRPRPAPVSVASLEEPALLEPQIEDVPAEEVSVDSGQIARIELASLIGTLHLDDDAGDDGLVIVVEPWDRSNQMLADAADISVVLIDPAEPAATSRYARWEFEAEETVNFFRAGDLPGLHLELPWPDAPPRHDELHLFVRYTTSDGRKLETDSAVEIELGGHGRWVATDTPRIRPYEQAIAIPEPTPASPVAPELLAVENQAVAAASKRLATPVRTISLPRETSESDSRESRTESQRRPEPAKNSARTTPRPLPKPELEPEPPVRQRPVWSPDRPW